MQIESQEIIRVATSPKDLVSSQDGKSWNKESNFSLYHHQ
jgi:hypothetical protein